MSSSFFQFKEFGIHQDKCAMKVSTDGVLLGALAGSRIPRTILDIGIGTGVVSLMLAQRFKDSMIHGVEVDLDAYNQAIENADRSPWRDRLYFLNERFQNFYESSTEKFDLIVTNPPYFTNHLRSLDPKRNLALHAGELPFEDLIAGVAKLLNQQGELWIILPPAQMEIFKHSIQDKGLNAVQSISVYDRQGEKMLRKIVVFTFGLSSHSNTNIFLKNADGSYSEDYSYLLKNYLLIF